ncbi:MAG: FAD-dependent oxidoreductase, partial [Firmicutes bacterium]|nr:FAD-dependent oxidoreductase [Bacillota bacterium]
QRSIPIESGYDLVVAGGGPAGSAAAICAARLGARVLLVEATGCLGGMATSGLVTAFDPMADGEKMIVGGFMREVVETMYHRGYIAEGIEPDTWRKNYHQWTPFKVEGLKRLLDELAVGAGVEVRFFTRVIDIDADQVSRQVKGLILHNVEGYRYVAAKTFCDATGDAVLADLCGVPCREAGRDTEKIMPATLCSLYTGIDWEQIPRRGCIPDGQQEAIEQAIDEDFFTQPDRHVPGMFYLGNGNGMLNAGHIFGMNALNCRSLSDGMMLGRRLAVEYTDFYRKYMKGFEKLEHVVTASLMGVRESRRIVGEYELTFDDYINRRQFPDQIGVFNKAIDIHVYDCTEAEYQRYYEEFHSIGRLGQGECFGIPYGILVPVGWQNLWVAGRCSSSDVRVHGSIRVQPAAAMMGQAAGTAAVQSIRTGRPACSLDTDELVTTLRGQGAYLPQLDLSREMTRLKR